MKCSVYIHEMKITECDLMPSDDSMCVAHAQVYTAISGDAFTKMLLDNDAINNDGIIDFLKKHGLRVLDDNGTLIPSVGSCIMYCPELNRTELDVYGIDEKYYKSRFHCAATDVQGLA